MKIIVLGMDNTGKTTLCKNLKYFLNFDIVNSLPIKSTKFEIENYLSSKGYKTFGCGRSKIEKENYISVDLSTKEGIDMLYNRAKEYLGNIDILVNNAGEYIYSNIEKTSYEQMEHMTKLNFYAPYYLSSLVIPDMKKNKWGPTEQARAFFCIYDLFAD